MTNNGPLETIATKSLGTDLASGQPLRIAVYEVYISTIRKLVRVNYKIELLSPATTSASGLLVVGNPYTITTYNAGDDFTNVGAASNAAGVSFVATDTTPTAWAAGSTLTCTGIVVHAQDGQYARFNQPAVLYSNGEIITPEQMYPVGTVVPAVTNSASSGLLTLGTEYTITTYNAGDDFTNVGAASNASGVTFTATGTTPTAWAAGSTLTGIVTAGFTATGTQVQTPAVISDGTQVKYQANMAFDNLKASPIGQGIIADITNDLSALNTLADVPKLQQTVGN